MIININTLSTLNSRKFRKVERLAYKRHARLQVHGVLRLSVDAEAQTEQNRSASVLLIPRNSYKFEGCVAVIGEANGRRRKQRVGGGWVGSGLSKSRTGAVHDAITYGR